VAVASTAPAETSSVHTTATSHTQHILSSESSPRTLSSFDPPSPSSSSSSSALSSDKDWMITLNDSVTWLQLPSETPLSVHNRLSVHVWWRVDQLWLILWQLYAAFDSTRRWTKRWRISFNLLSTEAICRVYIKIKPFSAEAPPRTPLGAVLMLSHTQESDEEGILSPHSPLLSPRDPKMLRCPSELVPPLFRQYYALLNCNNNRWWHQKRSCDCAIVYELLNNVIIIIYRSFVLLSVLDC